MNEKTKLLLGIAAFFLVIFSSLLLYRYLGKNYSPESSDRLSGSGASISRSSSSPEDAAPRNSDAEADNSPSPSASEKQASESIPAPDFSVEDRDGNMISFSDLIGNPIVINFWASWCPPCKAEMPEFDTVYRELEGEVTFLMINSTDGARETVETAAAYIDEQNYSFPVYFDTSQEASYVYGISSLPTTVFIDRDGYLVTGAIGMIDEATLRRGIDMIMDRNVTP